MTDGLLDLWGISGCSLRYSLAFSRPCPIRSAIEGDPGARLLDDSGLDPEIHQFPGLGDAFAIHDVELDLLEWRRDLVLDDFDAGLIADHLFAILDGADAANIEADRGIELEALPPLVVSGLPNITPIFMRI